MTEKNTTEKTPGTWAQLQKKLYSLRPIHNDEDYDKALAVADSLAGRDDLTDDQQDYLEVLVSLLGVYEDEHYAIDTSDADPIETLKFLMEQNEMNPSDLGRLLGDRSLGSRVLNGDRQLSKKHIAILGDHFAVNPSLFFPSLEHIQNMPDDCPSVKHVRSSKRVAASRHASRPLTVNIAGKGGWTVAKRSADIKMSARAATPRTGKSPKTAASMDGKCIAPREKGVSTAAKKRKSKKK
jgi:HTH-type transcriptional regulator / antitoxin HigA